MSLSLIEVEGCQTTSPGPISEHGNKPDIKRAITQDSMSVTLGGPSIFSLAVFLILGVRLFEPRVLVILISVIPVLLFVQNDYQNFLKLGPGGSPSNIKGYIRVNWLKLWAIRDPFKPPKFDRTINPTTGILSEQCLPSRIGPRPKVAGIAPQRQYDQRGSQECYILLRQILESHARKHSEKLTTGVSCFERHGLALFARDPVNNTCNGEICHVHSSDFSLHMNLHPEDAREVIEKGWGQRHPVARRAPPAVKLPVPWTFVMVYAPRSQAELATVCRIIEAASWWIMVQETKIEVA